MKGEIFRKLSWVLRIVIILIIAIYFRNSDVAVLTFMLVLFAFSFVFLFFDRKKRDIICLIEFLYLTLVILHIIGIALDLYVRLMIFDDILHLYGGIILGLFIFSLLHERVHRWKLGLLTIAIVFVGIIAWEGFEFFWDLFVTPIFNTDPAQTSRIDTMTDLIVGIAGGVIAVLTGNKFLRLFR